MLKKREKILVAVGGSGGHILPAEALVKELVQKQEFEVLFAGAGLEKNPFFDKKTYSYQNISSSQKSPLKLVQGFVQSLKLIRRYQPDLIIGFGSFHSLPLLAAALFLRYPYVLYASDIMPGRVVRLFAPFARFVGLSFPEAKKHVRGQMRLVAPPLRDKVKEKTSREEALSYFGLDPERKTLLVFGGSQGAKRLSDLVSQALQGLKREGLQVIHFCGVPEKVKELSDFYKASNVSAVVKAFEPEMGLAWSAADAVVCRSGAMTLLEQLYHQVPALYVPFPYAKDNHQKLNAHYGELLGAGTLLEEKMLTPDLLMRAIDDLLKRDKLEAFPMFPSFSEEILQRE